MVLLALLSGHAFAQVKNPERNAYFGETHLHTSWSLDAYLFGKNLDSFILPARVSFRHLFFSPDRRGQRAHDDAVKAQAKLAGRAVDATVATSLADPFMLQDYYGDRTPEQIAKEFGPPFAQALFRLVPGGWQGPIESGYGWHLVSIDSLVPGRVPAFEEIEADVKTAWLGREKEQAWRKAYEAMRAKYTVMLPAPPDMARGGAPNLPAGKELPTSSTGGSR